MLYKFSFIPKFFFLTFLSVGFHQCFSQQFNAELINQQTIIEATEGKLIETNFFEIRINNRSGDKYAEVSIPFNKMNKVSNIEASVFDISGKEVKKLKKSDIIETSLSSSMSLYTDSYVKEFELRHNTYPYTLKYSFQIEASQFFYITHWCPVIDNDIPTREATLKFSASSTYKVNYVSNLVKPPKIDSISGRTYYVWHTSFQKPVKHESWSPPLVQFIPCIDIVPEKFSYETGGSQESWTSYGNWNYKLQYGLDDLPLTERLKIHTLTDSIQDTKEKIRVLYHYLQDATRYVNVSIKTGGLKPYPASYVAENKYGDCKALSNYFRTCLSDIGIKSFYTTINADEVIDSINESFPSQQFNHVILFIPLKQDTLWVDCTSDLAFGYLGTFTQNRFALVLDLYASQLIKTPALTFSDVLETRYINAKINADKSITANFADTYRGDKYEILSEINTSLSEAQRKQVMSRVVQTGFQLDKYSISTPERDTPESTLKYTATSDQMFREYGTESLVKIIPLEFDFLEEPKKRKLPVQINYPEYRVDTIEYTIPENYKITAFPKNIAITSGYGEYHADFQVKDHKVKAIKQVKINSGLYPLNNYQMFYDFIIRIGESENSYYITLMKI